MKKIFVQASFTAFFLIGCGGNSLRDASSNFFAETTVVANVATFSRPRGDYTVANTGATFTVTDNVGTGGIRSFTGLERLVFSDVNVNLQVADSAAKLLPADLSSLAELYVAFFNRIPDADGLNYWINQLIGGQSLNQIADAFYTAGIANSTTTGYTATMSNSDFVNLVYRNVLGRINGADLTGLAYWTGKLSDKSATRGSLVISILTSAHTFKGDPAFGYVANLLDNKILVAKILAVDAGISYTSGSESITRGTAIATAVTSVDTAAALRSSGIFSSVLFAHVKKSSPVLINVPIISNASDPFGGNAAGTAVLDFDGDGLKDLLITPSYLSKQPELPVILLRQTSAGFVDASTSAFGATVPTTGVARTPLVADFNGDGKEDYFTSDTGLEVFNAGKFILSRNRLFTSGKTGLVASQVDTLAFNHGACKGDIDGDGRIDIIVAPLSQPKTYVLLNKSSGFMFDQTRLPLELTTYTTEDFSPSSCALFDMNGDGKLDLIVSGYRDGLAGKSPGAPYATGTRIFLNDGNGNFLPSKIRIPRPLGADWGSTSIRIADFDKNGKPDILIAYETGDGRFALQLLLQTSQGIFEDKTLSSFGTYETNIGFWREMDIGDFNGDGNIDIYLRKLFVPQGSFSESLRQRIFLNDGTGKFANPSKTITLSEPVNPTFMLTAESSNGKLSLFGYETEITDGVYTKLIPFILDIIF